MFKLMTLPKAFVTGFIGSSVAIAAASGDLQLRKVYDDLQSSKNAFFSLEIAKKDFPQKFKNLDAELKAKYSKIQTLEGDGLSVEGNQTALDLELLEPLRMLATNQITKKSCSEAKHQNALNTSPDEIAQIKIIETLVTKLCN